MKAIVEKSFRGLEDGAAQVRTIQRGETIGGDLAKVAVDNGWAKEVKDEPAAPKGKK